MKTLVSAIWFLCAVICLEAQNQPELAVGDRSPDFSLPFATKDSIAKTPLKLSDFVGKSVVVLAFYPADWSSGCTKEVCALRDNFSELQSLNAEVLGVSGDYVWSHHEWAKFHNLPFRLLSDHAHIVARQFASYNEKSLYNRRTVFVIDKQGAIAYKNMAYSVADNQDFLKLKSAIESLR